MDYTFTLKYKLPAHETDMDALVERLGAQGCTDATVGIGKVGRLGLQFVRAARSAEMALRSAVEDVYRTIASAQLVEAGPDFVGLSEIATYVGVTRQNLHKLTQTHWSSFPSPIHEGSAPTWHLAEVLQWLQEQQNYPLERAHMDIARACQALNAMNQLLRHQTGKIDAGPISAMAMLETGRSIAELLESIHLRGKVQSAASA